MEINFYIPKNEILKKYIAGYYFLNANKDESPTTYWTFPNNYCILSTNINSTSTFIDNKINLLPENNNLVSSDLVFRYTKPIEITVHPPICEITIYFKPLGLNHFINNLGDFFNRKDNYKFSPFEDFEDSMSEIFKENSIENQTIMLERYWISKLCNNDFTLMNKFLNDINNGLSVENIAKANNYTRQYILKLFKSHIGKSITEYRKINRFRNSLRIKNMRNGLTELAYDNDYYDQSHFIKDFKELTNLKPKAFFKNVDVHKPTIWNFVK